MSEFDTAAILARLNAACKGTWEDRGPGTLVNGMRLYVLNSGELGDRVNLICHPADATFIEHAQEDIIALLNRVSDLEEELELAYNKLEDEIAYNAVLSQGWPDDE